MKDKDPRGRLKGSHESLLTVLDGLDAAVYAADMDTYEILFANEYVRGLWGDVVGETCWRVMRAGQSGPCDFCTNERLLTPDGEPSGVYTWEFQNPVTGRWYEMRDRAIRWADGRIVRLSIAIDISKRVRRGGVLEAAHALQQSIIDGVAEPIMVIGEDYRIKTMNRAARELSSEGAGTSKPSFCYQISHQREAPCEAIGHPCPLEQVHKSGQPVRVVHEHYQANGERHFVEVIAAPLWGADGTFQGIIESMRDITERVQAQEALQQYAERQRALTAQLAEVSEAERQRLARELHDQVGQRLTALGINLNIVRTQMSEETAAAVCSRLDDSLLLVEQTTECIRDLMADLRPAVLDDYGLVAALHWYREQFARRTDVAIAVEGEEPVPRLAARVENALFRIAQEALTNVAKHAQARHVTVTVQVKDGILRLVIADDGIGFDLAHLAEPDGSRGWGLLTMAERAEAVGGRCWIESEPGQGTQVIVEVAQSGGRKP